MEIDGGDGLMEGEATHTHTDTLTVKYVWGVGRNVRSTAALGSSHPYNGS